jgi:hypothetical protein
MGMIGGGVGAATCVAAAWLPAQELTLNLSSAVGTEARGGLLGAALLVGYLAGSALGRRARRDRRHLGLFAAVTGAVAGGLLGASAAIVVTALYLHAYGAWPPDLLDRVLMVLGFACFAGLGWFVGAVPGFLMGAVSGGVLRLLTLRR